MVPSSSPSQSKKPLIIDPTPKSGPPTAPPNSASSSSTTNTQPPEKRTRDQPNLSDCHCCGGRINHTNPNDRLQPLDSLWRIVLLCRKCRKKVRSGQTCPYCFHGTGDSGRLFTCRECERKIHKDCVRDYENCTPWRYLGAGLEGFRVCVDCWVPELLKSSVRVSGSSENKNGLKDKGDGKDLLENAVKEKKVKIVAKAKEQGLKSTKVTKSVVDLANGSLDLSANREKGRVEADIANRSGAIEVPDDAELAIQLHRAMNSSPRILRSKSLVNTNDSDASNLRDWNGLSYKTYQRSTLGKNNVEAQKLGTRVNNAENEHINQPGENGSRFNSGRLNFGLITYKRDRKRKIWILNDEITVVSESRTSQQSELKSNLCSDDPRNRGSMKSSVDMSEASISGNADQRKTCTNVDSFGRVLLYYKRKKFRHKVCQVNDLLGVSGECSSSRNDRRCQSDDAKLSTGFQGMSDTEVVLPSQSCNTERDRYHLKYAKRIRGTKSGSSFLHHWTFISENQASAPALSDPESYQSGDADNRTSCPVNSDSEGILPSASGDAEQDPYHWKYGKRVTDTKSDTSLLRYDALQSEHEVSELAPVNSDSEVILLCGSCDAKQDRYHWKYSKRVSGTKSDTYFLRYGTFPSETQGSAFALSNSGADYSVKCDGELILPNGSSNQSSDRYRFKYAKRVKSFESGSIADTNLHSDALLKEIEASAPVLTTNCSTESKTASDVLFD